MTSLQYAIGQFNAQSDDSSPAGSDMTFALLPRRPLPHTFTDNARFSTTANARRDLGYTPTSSLNPRFTRRSRKRRDSSHNTVCTMVPSKDFITSDMHNNANNIPKEQQQKAALSTPKVGQLRERVLGKLSISSFPVQDQALFDNNNHPDKKLLCSQHRRASFSSLAITKLPASAFCRQKYPTTSERSMSSKRCQLTPSPPTIISEKQSVIARKVYRDLTPSHWKSSSRRLSPLPATTLHYTSVSTQEEGHSTKSNDEYIMLQHISDLSISSDTMKTDYINYKNESVSCSSHDDFGLKNMNEVDFFLLRPSSPTLITSPVVTEKRQKQ
mmetsp:Transcript_22681/g.26160  ORF Transcript_22681/g.26160 Transcript_22681/m.26160 type:complete len:328 (+) Transcript_22681:199-1182(+)